MDKRGQYIPPNPAEWTNPTAVSLLKTKIYDDYIAYKVVKMMVQDWTEMDAYKQGYIDEHGHIIQSRKSLNTEQKKEFTKLDILIINMKKTILKFTPYSVFTWAQALQLIKEDVESRNDVLFSEQYIKTCLTFMEDIVPFLTEDGAVSGTAPTNTTTTTGPAVTQPVGGSRGKIIKRKRKPAKGAKLHEALDPRGEDAAMRQRLRDLLVEMRDYSIQNPEGYIAILDEETLSISFIKLCR